jgi:hypothetical protein
MERDILFYQANFEPEVFRMIDAFEKNDMKYFNFFKTKTIKIVDKILEMSKSFAEKEEWFVVRNLVEDFEFIGDFEVQILKKYGNPFSVKFAKKLSSI